MKRIFLFMLLFSIIIVPYITRSISAKEPITAIKKIEYINVLVHGGDTLWSISEQHRGERDLQTFMTIVQQLNNMNHTVVREGSYIKIPVF